LLDLSRRRKHAWPVLVSLVVAMSTGCGDDTALTTEGPMVPTSGTTDATPITFSMPDTTEGTTVVADDTASGTDSTGSTGLDDTSTTGDDTTTGGEAVPGQSMNQLVSAGERTASRNYTLVYTFGQPSSLQSTHQSSNYSIQGGLIGANGSPP
jgi:hypothetical protein